MTSSGYEGYGLQGVNDRHSIKLSTQMAISSEIPARVRLKGARSMTP